MQKRSFLKNRMLRRSLLQASSFVHLLLILKWSSVAMCTDSFSMCSNYSAKEGKSQTKTTSSLETLWTGGTTVSKPSNTSFAWKCFTLRISLCCEATTNPAKLPPCTAFMTKSQGNTETPTLGNNLSTCSITCLWGQ